MRAGPLLALAVWAWRVDPRCLVGVVLRFIFGGLAPGPEWAFVGAQPVGCVLVPVLVLRSSWCGFGICPDAILPYGSWFLYEVRKHLSLFTMPGEGGVVMGGGSLRQPYFHCWKLSRMELLMR